MQISPATPSAVITKSNMSPFGDLNAMDLTPLVQLDFVYGINTQTGVSSVANSATVDVNSSRLRIQSGTNAAGSGIFTSKKSIKYRPGQGNIARFTPAFAAGVANSTQIMGVGTAVDGYFIGFNGASFGIMHRVRSVDTWVAQTAWNGDKCDGSGDSGFTIDPTKGNVFQVKYPYLGYGNITLWVQNSITSEWILCHTIKYTNSSVSTQLSNPNLLFYAQVINSGNTSNLIMYCGSVGVFVSGPRQFVGCPKWAADNNKATITAETNILSIKNCTTYNGVTNRSQIRINSISFGGGTANAVLVLRVRINATVGGSPSFAAINGTTADGGVTITSGNSVASVDTAGTTTTGGTYIYNISSSASSGQLIDLTPFDIFVAPGDIVTFSVFASASSTASVSVNWTEDI